MLNTKVARFGRFEFDLTRYELRTHGMRVRLSASQLRLLTLFVERPGELITRDEISAALWSNTQNIDVPSGINTAVNRLRSHLSDTTSNPAFIETVVGLGYRFIASIEMEHEPPLPTPVPSEPEILEEGVALTALVTPTSAVAPRARYERLWAGAVAVSLLFLIGLGGRGARLWTRTPPKNHSSVNVPQKANGVQLHTVSFDEGENRVSAMAVSPDGKMLAYVDNAGLSVSDVSNTSSYLRTLPPDLSVEKVSWLPHQQAVLLSGEIKETKRKQIWVEYTLGGEPRLLLDQAQNGIASPDGHSIAYTRDNGTQVWTAGYGATQPRKLISADTDARFQNILWAPSGDRIVVTEKRSKTDGDLWTYESVDVSSGKVLATQANGEMKSGYLLPDGRLFYLLNNADEVNHHSSLMVVLTDPKSGRFLGLPQQFQDLQGTNAISLSASADGTQMAVVFDREKPDVFVADLSSPGAQLKDVHRITHNFLRSFPHAWMPDGSAVLMEDSISGKDSIYEQPLSGPATMLAQVPEAAAMEEITPDGKSVLFLQVMTETSVAKADAIYRVSLHGGPPQKLAINVPIEEFHCPVASSGKCVLRSEVGQQEFVYYELDPDTGLGKEIGRTAAQPRVLGDWSISPDGNTVAIANHDRLHPHVDLVHLHASPTQVNEIAVQGHGLLEGATWMPDGRTLLVQSKDDAGYDLLLVDLAGHIKALRHTVYPIWGVPSRDGKKLAFPEYTKDTNVWTGTAAF